jgi:dienelactone hydrolase
MPRTPRIVLRVVAILLPLVGCSTPRDEAPSNDSPVTVDVDVIYGHKAGMALTFDVYHPHDGNGAAVLFMNSGALRSPAWGSQREAVGSSGYRFIHRDALPAPEYEQTSFDDLLANGFTVFDVRHGSSPWFTVPEIVEDVRLAVRYVRAHAADFRVDADRIGVWGPSAGGVLSVMLGTSGDDGDPAADNPVDRASSRVNAVVAYYPSGYDIVSMVRRFPDGPGSIPALQIDEDVLESLAIRNHISADDAPTLIIYGEEDAPFITEDSDSMYSAFQRHGVVSRLITIPGTGHEFRLGDVYHSQHAERAMAELLAWFQQHLLNE